MGARGPHNDFESAKNLLRAAYAAFTVEQDVDEAIRPARALADRDGKMVFNEGYVDRRKAFADLGVEEP